MWTVQASDSSMTPTFRSEIAATPIVIANITAMISAIFALIFKLTNLSLMGRLCLQAKAPTLAPFHRPQAEDSGSDPVQRN